MLNSSEFEHPPEEFLHYYIYIRSTDDVTAIFSKMEQLHSAETIVVYYDRADASTFDAISIVSILNELKSIQIFEFVPTEQCRLDNLEETIVEILEIYEIDNFSSIITSDADLNQYSVLIRRNPPIMNRKIITAEQSKISSK